jgi:hypothetical protein
MKEKIKKLLSSKWVKEIINWLFIIFALIIVIIIACVMIVDFCEKFLYNIPKSLLADKDWGSEKLSFYGDVFGSFVGFITGFFSAVLAIGYSSSQSKKDRREAEDRFREDKRLSIMPVLDSNIFMINRFEEYFLDVGDTFRIMSCYAKTEIIDDKGGTEIFSKTLLKDKLQNNNTLNFSINIKNIGLAVALNVEIVIYQLKENESTKCLYDYNYIPNDFYDKLELDNFKFYEKDELKFDNYWEFTNVFNLGIENKPIRFVNSIVSTSEKPFGTFHMIMEFRYTDLYNNRYYQYQHLYIAEKKLSRLPISAPYTENDPKRPKRK